MGKSSLSLRSQASGLRLPAVIGLPFTVVTDRRLGFRFHVQYALDDDNKQDNKQQGYSDSTSEYGNTEKRRHWIQRHPHCGAGN
jgi:hypothetical protein